MLSLKDIGQRQPDAAISSVEYDQSPWEDSPDNPYSVCFPDSPFY